MFNGQYVKIDTILAEIRKYPFVEDLTKREASHSLVKLLGFVGAVLPLQRKYQNVEIKMHKGELPTDIVYIHGVNNKGNSCGNPGVAMRYASDIYHSALHSEEARKVICGDNVTAEDVAKVYPPTNDGDQDIEGMAAWGETVLAPALSRGDIPREVFENSYNINGMSIDTSFPYGWVEIAYDSVMTDSEGFPMIPDTASFREAFKYFLLKNAMEPAWMRGQVQRAVYDDINTQYAWYIGQAQNHFNMPSPDQMETLANGLLRILPKAHHYKDGFKSFNKPE